MINLILAHDEGGGVGYKNGLPWSRINEDMKRFREATLNQVITMGRKTFESLGCKPLLKRENIVLSRRNVTGDGDFTVTDQMDELFRWYKTKQLFVIGGREIYEQSEAYATRILLTRVMGKFRADTFWKPNLEGWTCESTEDWIEHGNKICVFEDWRRAAPLIH